MDALSVEVAKLQEQWAAENSELRQSSARYSAQINELGHMQPQHTTGTTVSVDLKSVAGACERPAERAKVTLTCKESFPTPSPASFPALIDGAKPT